MAPYRARMIERLVLAISLAFQLGALYAIARMSARSAALVERLTAIPVP
jgi:hypothetical protein